uniref:Uncharacterized protein n=1 Tax=Wuchereria bancrofti TaxID=6293 RepID=A0A1I8ENY8_WUCBA
MYGTFIDNKELDIPTTRSDFNMNTFQNVIVRFLPAISQTFQCHLDEEKVVNEWLEAKSDEGSSGAADNGRYCDPVFIIFMSENFRYIYQHYFLYDLAYFLNMIMRYNQKSEMLIII